MRRTVITAMILGVLGSVATAEAQHTSPASKAPASQAPATTSAGLAKLTASDGTVSDRFGISISVSGDTAVVGAPHETTGTNLEGGAAYVYVRRGGAWVEQAKLVASDSAPVDRFGFTVAISGNTAIVGAFFDDVGLNPDQGSAYVFTRSGGIWTQQAKLTADDGAAADSFGYRVAVDGSTAVVGSYWADVAGQVDQGAAYVFVRAGTTWAQQAKLVSSDGAGSDQFGHSVAVSGRTAVVGSNNHGGTGAAYVFAAKGATWTERAKLTASDAADGSGFGFALGVSGRTIVVGDPVHAAGANTEQGAAYVFTLSGNRWVEQAKLTAADGAAGDFLGRSVAVSGDTVVAGAQFDDVDGKADQGSAYVYTRTRGRWTAPTKLVAPDGVASSLFGVAVSADRGTVAVGAGFADSDGLPDKGAAYVGTR